MTGRRNSGVASTRASASGLVARSSLNTNDSSRSSSRRQAGGVGMVALELVEPGRPVRRAELARLVVQGGRELDDLVLADPGELGRGGGEAVDLAQLAGLGGLADGERGVLGEPGGVLV